MQQIGDITELRRMWAQERESSRLLGERIAREVKETKALCAEIRETIEALTIPWPVYPGFQLVTEETENFQGR